MKNVGKTHLVAGRLGFYSQSGHSKDFKNSIRSFRAKRSAQAEVRRVFKLMNTENVTKTDILRY